MSSHQPDTFDNNDSSCDNNPASAEGITPQDVVTSPAHLAPGEEMDEKWGLDFDLNPVDSDDDFEDALPSSPIPYDEPDNAALSVDEKVRLCVQYLLVNSPSKIPVKRTELIDYAMNSQPKYFGDVMRQVEAIFKETFGMKIVKIKLDDDEQPSIANELDFGDKRVVAVVLVSGVPNLALNLLPSQRFCNLSSFFNLELE